MGDMSRVGTGRTYGLVYLVFNTIGNLLTQDDQVRCFQAVANANPVTIWANTLRALTLGNDTPAERMLLGLTTTTLLLWSALWIAGLLGVFVPLAIRMYRKNA